MNTLNGSDAVRKTSWLGHFSNITDAWTIKSKMGKFTQSESNQTWRNQNNIQNNFTCNDMYSIVYKPHSILTGIRLGNL